MSDDNFKTPLPEPTVIERAALEWFMRCDRGLTTTEEEQFADWLSADVRHAEVFNELSGTWNLLEHAAPGKMPEVSPRVRQSRRWLKWALPFAAAAAVALGYFSYWRPRHFSGDTATQVGAVRTMHLPDGSVARLSTDTEITVGFSPAERRVILRRGEASFAVAKNPARPFTVVANGVAVRAVGTSFNVRVAEKSVEVLVLEGKVRVSDAASGASLLTDSTHTLDMEGQPVLTLGERAVVPLIEPQQPAPAPAVVTTLLPDEMQRRTAWLENRLEFDSAPLSEMVAEFNRFSSQKIVIQDPALSARRFGGSFKADDSDGFVRMLHENFGIVVERTGGVTVLRNPK